MPDGAKNFTYDGTNGPISTTTVTRDELITAMEHMNYAEGYNIRAIDELGASGMIGVDSLGNAWARSIAVSDGLSVANATGASGNPTIGIGTPASVRQTITDTEANTITANVAVSILSTGTSYAVPAPDSGKITTKTIINNTSGMITLTGSVWADTGVTTVRIAPESKVDLVSDTVGKWYAYHPAIKPGMGALYTTSAAATVMSDSTTYVEDPSTTSLNTSESMVYLFDQPANGRLRYTGKVPAHGHIAVTLTVSTASNSDIVHHRVVHYDASATTATELTHSEVKQKSQATGGDFLSTALHADVVLEENDYIYIASRNAGYTSPGDDVTLDNKYIFCLANPIMTT